MHLQEFSVHISPKSLTLSPHGKVLGHIWVQVDDVFFPEQEWDDFVVVIMGWWLDGFLKISMGKQSKCICSFMDGPFEFTVTPQTQERWLIEFFEKRRTGKTCELKGVFDARSVVGAMLLASDKVIKLCQRNGWQPDEVDTLVNFHSQLRALPNLYN